jgi:zinc protease
LRHALKRWIPLPILLCVLAGTAPAKDAGDIEYIDYKLDNGLRVILSEDHSTAVAAVDVWYHVGSGSEELGRSGFAHLFEHMMFEGSENVPRGEHRQWIARVGGSMNGSTTEDRTNYFETVPSNALELALWLEADRMRALAITKENFENQRSTVKEERRQRVDNQPYMPAYLTSDTLSYDYPPYSHTVIGKMVDLDAAEVQDVQAFFDLYYAPNNAVLVVVGDIDPDETKEMIERHFGDIPRGHEPPPVMGSQDIPRGEQRRKDMEDANANLPAVFITYLIPPHGHPDTYALSILGSLLVDGESSRLYKKLVKEEEVALAVFGGAEGRKGPGIFRFIAVSNAGEDIHELENLIYAEIDRLIQEGIPERELEKARNQFKTGFVQGRQTCLRKAETLHHYIRFHEDLSEINTDLDKYVAVTEDDVIAVAKKYFFPENRCVVTAVPSGSEEGEGSEEEEASR